MNGHNFYYLTKGSYVNHTKSGNVVNSKVNYKSNGVETGHPWRSSVEDSGKLYWDHLRRLKE